MRQEDSAPETEGATGRRAQRGRGWSAGFLVLMLSSACNSSVDGEASLTRERLVHEGVPREYALYRPGTNRGDDALPLLLLFHGGHGHGERLAARLGMNAIAEREGFIVAYPDAVEGHWNDGRTTTATDIDDVAFVDSLIADIASRHPVDRDRVYAAGISNGGSFTARLACELTDRIAAVAQVVSTMSVELHGCCEPQRPIPIMLINGVDDPLVPWRGGSLRQRGRLGKGGTVISAEEAVAFWAGHNGCPTEPDTRVLKDSDPDDGTRVEQTRYLDCRDDTAVVLLAVRGGGHTWPGTPERPRLSRIVGRTSQDVDASEVIWEFVSRYRLQ